MFQNETAVYQLLLGIKTYMINNLQLLQGSYLRKQPYTQN